MLLVSKVPLNSSVKSDQRYNLHFKLFIREIQLSQADIKNTI